MNDTSARKLLLSLPSPTLPVPGSAERRKNLWRSLDYPGRSLRVIKVLGESGKTCLADRIVSILKSQGDGNGYCVGSVSLVPSDDPRLSVRVDGIPLSHAEFAEAVSLTASAAGFTRGAAEKPACTYDEILLLSALVAFRKRECQIAVLILPCTPGSAASMLASPILSVIASIGDLEAADRVRAMLDGRGSEVVSAPASDEIYRRIAAGCVSINCRLTFPWKNECYLMDRTPSSLRFIYRKKEYRLASPAYYQMINALVLIETYEAFERIGLRLRPGILTEVLATPDPGDHFRLLSLFPTVIVDNATTAPRLAALRETLENQADHFGNSVEIWTTGDIALVAAHELAVFSPVITVIDAFRLREIRAAFRSRDPALPLLILGDKVFTAGLSRILGEIL